MKNPRQSIACLVLILASFISIKAHAELEWVKGEGLPSDWTPLENNLLANKSGVVTGTTSFLTPLSDNIVRITDGLVPTSRSYKEMLGFAKDSTVEWDFGGPITLEKIRITTCDITDGRQYDNIAIDDVLIKTYDSEDWVSLECGSVEWSGSNKEGIMCYVILEDSLHGRLSESVTALRIKFGQHTTVAQYYSEIEAVGFAEATGPVLGSFDIAVSKTKAKVSGVIADCGTDATACDVYLSLNGARGVKIAKAAMGSFEYQLRGLKPATTYAYVLSVSNNAPIAKITVKRGEFTTLAADAQTASWTQSEFAVGSWSPLEKNILGGLAAMVMSGESGYASSDSLVLTDGVVPFSKLQSDGEAGAMTVGFKPNGTIAWEFNKPTSIEKIRLSSYWWTMQYNGISVNTIWVKFKDNDGWQALDVPAVEWKGGTEFVQTMTLTDAEYGFIAKNIVGLKIVFGPQKAAVANYYAEIEAIGREITPGFMMLMR